MSGQHQRLVHVDEVHPENMKKDAGWAISEFRLPITGKDGSSTTLFHSIFRPGSTHAKHSHARSDEIAVYLKGHGIVGQSNERMEVRPGHCRLMPKGSVHFFHNVGLDYVSASPYRVPVARLAAAQAAMAVKVGD